MTDGTKSSVLHERIMHALSAIQDPELNRSIVELGMVRDVTLDGLAARVTIALTIPSCPMKGFFTETVPARVQSEVPELTSVEVELDSMDDDERARISGDVRGNVTPVGLAGSKTRIIAVASGKGGVGKSTVAVNLAVALGRRGLRVGLLDADVWGYCVPRLLGATAAPTIVGNLILPLEAHGIAALSLGNIIGAGRSVVWRGPMLHKALEQLLRDVHWDDRDILVIDLPPGTGDVSISLAQLLPGSASFLLVTTPPEVTQEVASRAARMLTDAGLTPLGVVVNMSTHICSECGHVQPFTGDRPGVAIAEQIDTRVVAEIPYEPELSNLSDASEPIVVARPDSPAARAFNSLADTIAGQPDRARRLLPMLA